MIRLCNSRVLARPEPAERASRQETVHKTIEDVLQGRSPIALAPDGILEVRERISCERHAPNKPEHFKVVCTPPKGVARDISSYDAHQHAVEEPLHQTRPH